MGFFQKIIDDFGLGQHKVDEEALYAQIALFKDDLKAQEGKYTNQDEAIQFRDKWADLYKEAKAARLGKKSPLWEERKQFTDTFDRLAEVLTGYNSAVIAAESKRCDALLSDIDGKNLDPQQRAVVLCNEKRMLVLAGAGSGKTLTIAGKVMIIGQLTSHIYHQSTRKRKDCRNQPFFLFPTERYVHSDRIITFDRLPYHSGIDHLLVVYQALHKTVLICFLTKKTAPNNRSRLLSTVEMETHWTNFSFPTMRNQIP